MTIVETEDTAVALDDDTSPDERSNADLVRRAHGGDRRAWEQLVDRHVALIWSIVRQFRLDDADAADVIQTTWLRLLENLERLTDPNRVNSWLATTAKRECMRIVADRKRTVVSEDAFRDRRDTSQPDVATRLLAEEERKEVRAAIATLPPRWRNLLELLSADPPMSYADIAARLGIPVGSIGPTRARSLERLRLLLASDPTSR